MNNQLLPAWDHQMEYNSIRDRYWMRAREMEPIKRLMRIKGTTANYWEALETCFPEGVEPDLYKAFPSGRSNLRPFNGVISQLITDQNL